MHLCKITQDFDGFFYEPTRSMFAIINGLLYAFLNGIHFHYLYLHSHVGAAACPHKRELKGSAWDKRGISERSCLAPTLVDRHSGSAQGTTPTASRPPFVFTSFRTFALMRLVPALGDHKGRPYGFLLL